MSPSADGNTAGAEADGTQTSVGHPTQSPVNPRGAMPITVKTFPFNWIVRPITSGERSKRRVQ
jgi:hypothetical protein